MKRLWWVLVVLILGGCGPATDDKHGLPPKRYELYVSGYAAVIPLKRWDYRGTSATSPCWGRTPDDRKVSWGRMGTWVVIEVEGR